MSRFLPEETKAHFAKHGWCILKDIIPEPESIAASVIKDPIACVFQSEDEKKAVARLCKKKIDPLTLLTDTELRKKYLKDLNVFGNGNSRTPKVPKNNGIANIYHNADVRDKVSFNEDVYNSINQVIPLSQGYSRR